MLRFRERPVGVVRAGGRNDGSDPPGLDMAAKRTLLVHHRIELIDGGDNGRAVGGFLARLGLEEEGDQQFQFGRSFCSS